MKCRHCQTPVEHMFLDLGFAPPSNAYLSSVSLSEPELYFPLKTRVCDQCWLVQTEDYAKADELFRNDYAYFSSVSRSWLDHAARYSRQMIDVLNLGSHSFMIEIACNDGYLLKNFVAADIPCLGIEPTESTAKAAEELGIPVRREFFGNDLAKKLEREGAQADLIAGNNVYAHVPDINDFTAGLKTLLKPQGVVTLEFPHILKLIDENQFDTIYHEHFSYLSLSTVNRIFSTSGLRIWNVESLPTHGGSLRVHGCRDDAAWKEQRMVRQMLIEEERRGLKEIDTYISFQNRADNVKNNLLEFLLRVRKEGKRVVAYGAAAKGNTLLNYAGVKPDLLPIVYDGAPSKQGKFLPGSHIPICSPDTLDLMKPDYILILPWNIAGEIMDQLTRYKLNGTRFFAAVPELRELR